MKNKNIITNDIAIKSKDEDLLNYYPFAEKIQKVIQGYANNPEPLTIGIYGKWGAGKSSLLNLVERHIEIFSKEKGEKRYIKFHYNPWIYQTKEEMLYDFFETLTRKLVYSKDDKLEKAGKLIKKYSRYLKSVKLSASAGVPKVFNMGVSFEPYEILQRLGEDLEGEEKSIHELKKDIDEILRESDKKIIVFIDDVDRLDKDEIFTLFKLIKINADFKNLIFIICLDHDYVAKAIHHRYGNDEKSGKEFLEKIINIPLELPLIEEADLDHFVKEKIKPVLKTKKIKQQDLDELFSSLNGSYFSSPREVVRILNSFAFSFFAIGDEVNVHDLFWIEYLKIKHFRTYQAIKEFASGYRSNQLFVDRIDFNDAFTKDKNETGFRRDLVDNHNEAYPIIDSLFPMNRSGTISAYQNPRVKPNNILDSELRISHVNHFEKYFSFHVKGKISELIFSNFLELIKDDKNEAALKVLLDMIENTGQWKIAYRINTKIESLIDDGLFKKLITFLVENLNVFSEAINERPNQIEIVQNISDKLAQKKAENKDFILFIAKSLDYFQLCYFIGVLIHDEDKFEYINELEQLLIAKVKDLEKHPFFKRKNTSKMIMEIWSRVNHKEFEKYILDYLDSEENIFAFITVFPDVWNGTINGMFKEKDYDYLTNTLQLSANKILGKIKEFIEDTNKIKTLDNIVYNWDEHENNSPMQNVEQFIYWHLLKENNDSNDKPLFTGNPSVH